jgi:hypothetical protein
MRRSFEAHNLCGKPRGVNKASAAAVGTPVRDGHQCFAGNLIITGTITADD